MPRASRPVAVKGTVTDVLSVTCAGATNEPCNMMYMLVPSWPWMVNSSPCTRAAPGMSVPIHAAVNGTVAPGWQGLPDPQDELGRRPLLYTRPSNVKPWLPFSITLPGIPDAMASVPSVILMVRDAADAEAVAGGAASGNPELGAVGGDPHAVSITPATASAKQA